MGRRKMDYGLEMHIHEVRGAFLDPIMVYFKQSNRGDLGPALYGSSWPNVFQRSVRDVGGKDRMHPRSWIRI